MIILIIMFVHQIKLLFYKAEQLAYDDFYWQICSFS